MKICFTIDDVIRNKTKAFIKAYNKDKGTEIDPDTFEATSSSLKDMFKFKTVKDFYRFLHFHKYILLNNIDKKLNLWLINMHELAYEEEKEIDFMWASPQEFNQSIGDTYFYLSKIATRIREVFFPREPLDIWKKCDVLVTADPLLITNKPEGKTVVKIEMPYNKEASADITYKNLEELLKDEEFITKIEK